ncbi:MAG: DUF3786 domain-containing protein [Planctomycetes bacterium]|nr:DUF3786 domain-containing protein [Planctomycetota bacterium]MBL7039948.1 DUF3786 domain-containing protein [Pirellulaceae bacterium]
MNSTGEGTAGFGVPPRQKNLDRATELGFEALASQHDEQLTWLGVERSGDVLRVPVLNDTLDVNLSTQKVATTDGVEIGPHWRILVLHYLAISGRPDRLAPDITFADLQTARSYNKVYEGRTVGRLCGTVGRTESGLRDAAAAIGGHAALGGDVAFDFDVFARLTMRLVWYAADEEFPPSATILLPSNMEDYFCAEDTVVLSERLVSRLCGRPF